MLSRRGCTSSVGIPEGYEYWHDLQERGLGYLLAYPEAGTDQPRCNCFIVIFYKVIYWPAVLQAALVSRSRLHWLCFTGGLIGVSWIGERAFLKRSMVVPSLQQEFIAFSVGSFRHEAFLNGRHSSPPVPPGCICGRLCTMLGPSSWRSYPRIDSQMLYSNNVLA